MFIIAVIAQVAEAASSHWESLLFGYGPLGAISWWLARLVEKLTKELRERDQLVRELSDKNAEALKSVAHKIGGMSRALVYNAATYGPENIRLMAEKELARMTAAMEPEVD